MEHIKFFQAEVGAFSPVTDREAGGDKSVTVVAEDKAVIERCYPLDSFIRKGGAAPVGKPERHNFNVYNLINGDHEVHALPIKYPKKDKDEIRLYFLRETGFYPLPNTTWFIFTRAGEPFPFIGFMPNTDWARVPEEIQRRQEFEFNSQLDNEDDNYQRDLHDPSPRTQATAQQVLRYPRNAELARQVIRASGYLCQINPDHQTFDSASTDERYMEAHHLVLVSSADKFPLVPLDVKPNIISLCPNCHRAIHFADSSTKKALLRALFTQRSVALTQVGINTSLEALCEMYGAH